MLNIIEQTYDWKWIPEKRRSTDTIVLHHSAGTGSVEDVHRIHRGQGWPGIGYHFYVRKNGEVYRGRPEEQIGTHTAHYNASTIGVCFEGNFEQEKSITRVWSWCGTCWTSMGRWKSRDTGISMPRRARGGIFRSTI